MYAYQKLIVVIIFFTILIGGGFVFYTNTLQHKFQGITSLIEPKSIQTLKEAEEGTKDKKNISSDTPSDTQTTPSQTKEKKFTIKRSIHDHIDSVNDLIFAFNLNSIQQTPYYKTKKNTYTEINPAFLLKMDYKELLQVNNSLEEFGVFIKKDSQYIRIQPKNT